MTRLPIRPWNFLAAACLVFLGSLRAEEPVSSGGFIQGAAAAYRAGRVFEALSLAVRALEADPGNPAAKNFVWSITRKIQKEKVPPPLKPGEADRAVALADKSMAESRRRAREVLGNLQDVRRRTAARNPRDILDGLQGMDRFLGKDLSADLADEQARAYQREILNNLQAALGGKVFVSPKDQLTAEGYLAYFRGEGQKALELWTRALKEDPSDRRLAAEAASLRSLVEKRAQADRIDDLTRQGRIHLRAGNWEEASRAWKEVLSLDPENQEARAGLAAGRVALEKEALRRTLKEKTEEGLVLYRQGDILAAAQVWLEVLQKDPADDEARAWLQHAGRRIKGVSTGSAPGPSPRGEKAAERRRDPERAMELYKQGVVLYAQDNVIRAVELWKEALAIDPQLSRAQEALRQAQTEISLQ